MIICCLYVIIVLLIDSLNPSFYLINVVNMIFNETIGAVSGDGNTLVPYLNNFIYFNFDHFKHTDYKYRLT